MDVTWWQEEAIKLQDATKNQAKRFEAWQKAEGELEAVRSKGDVARLLEAAGSVNKTKHEWHEALSSFRVQRDRTDYYEQQLLNRLRHESNVRFNWQELERLLSGEKDDIPGLESDGSPSCDFCYRGANHFVTELSLHVLRLAKTRSEDSIFDICGHCLPVFEKRYEQLQFQLYYQFLAPNGPALDLVLLHIPIESLVHSVVSEYCLPH